MKISAVEIVRMNQVGLLHGRMPNELMAAAKFVIGPTRSLKFFPTREIGIGLECDRLRIRPGLMPDQSQTVMAPRSLLLD